MKRKTRRGEQLDLFLNTPLQIKREKIWSQNPIGWRWGYIVSSGNEIKIEVDTLEEASLYVNQYTRRSCTTSYLSAEMQNRQQENIGGEVPF
jgi:hypothetical protein